MSQYGWNNCPLGVKAQINLLVAGFQSRLPENLIGIYLHGSLAMGCFNPSCSDIDLLAITRHKMAVEVKRSLAEFLLDNSLNPSRIEISFLRHSDMYPWRRPTPFDFHYSEDWRSDFERDLSSGNWKEWNIVQRYDDDLAAHITVVNHRGICLHGPFLSDIFPPVPKQDFIVSILGDVQSAKFGLSAILQYPVYVVLNACRTFAYLQTGRIMSKEEGGIWALQVLPLRFHNTVAGALEEYRNGNGASDFAKEQLADFATHMQSEVDRIMQLNRGT